MKQKGFTLIELIVVIVILGILAATALPKFIDVSSDAETAAVNGVAAGISSGASINYGARKVNASNGSAVTGANNAAVCTSAVIGPLLQGGIPSGYYITAGTTALASGVAYCKVCRDKDAGSDCDAGEPAVDNIAIPLIS